MLVSQSGNKRMVRILPRGNWLDKTGEVVEPAIPEFMGKLDIENRKANRLDLAKWVVSEDNPLPARAFTNRIWKIFFGYGLSRRLEDLGGQGEPPTHPQLLDYLSNEFRNNGWDIKQLIRTLVTSDAYKQSSVPTEKLATADPLNRLYARQSRFRVDAEFVRDTALSISGLLVSEIGGTSVKPYQPAGYWQHLNFPSRIQSSRIFFCSSVRVFPVSGGGINSSSSSLCRRKTSSRSPGLPGITAETEDCLLIQSSASDHSGRRCPSS